MSKDLLSVKEVADILGMSRQAIYSKLDKDFTPYLTIENGKKFLNKAVLQHKQQNETSTEIDKNFQSLVNLLEKQNEQLSKELEIKNKQIEQLQKLLDQQQQLTLLDKNKSLQIEAKKYWWQRKRDKNQV